MPYFGRYSKSTSAIAFVVPWMTMNHCAKFQGLKMNFKSKVGAVHFGHFYQLLFIVTQLLVQVKIPLKRVTYVLKPPPTNDLLFNAENVKFIPSKMHPDHYS